MERSCYDVRYYELRVAFDFDSQKIIGSNLIHFKMIEPSDEIQLDLFANMRIDSVLFRSKKLSYRREFNAVFLDTRNLEADQDYILKVFYSGAPIVAKNAPWDGGFVWTTDKLGRPWVAVACEGTGASLWWPNKDHLSDEPDSVDLYFEVPKSLFCVSNGDLEKVIEYEQSRTFHWKVDYPINNYNISFNIGHYAHFSDPYISAVEGNLLACDYYVLDYNLEKAKKHFKQNHDCLEAFEYYLGPYPFYKDGFALVETPYLGMEHQSAIAYGNKFMRGYLGGMIPNDMDWDYIIVHEGAHEWWGNAISASDLAEIWIHESFTTYMEALFVEYHYGYEDMLRYLNGQRRHSNREPIIGPLGVNYELQSGSDEYFKGAWILHTFRHQLGDSIFFSLLKEIQSSFRYQTIQTKDLLAFIYQYAKNDYSLFFEQYLYRKEIPKLLYKVSDQNGKLLFDYKWERVIPGFSMDLFLQIDNQLVRVNCTDDWQQIDFEVEDSDEITIRDDLILIDKKKIK